MWRVKTIWKRLREQNPFIHFRGKHAEFKLSFNQLWNEINSLPFLLGLTPGLPFAHLFLLRPLPQTENNEQY